MNHQQIIPYVFGGLLVWWAVWMVYWHGIRRRFLVRLKKHIDGLKHALESKEALLKDDAAYAIMMRRLTWNIDELAQLRLSAALAIDMRNFDAEKFTQQEKTIDAAKADIRNAYQKLLAALTGAMALNAPFLVFVLGSAVVTFAWTSRVRKQMEHLRRVIFGGKELGAYNGARVAHA